MGHVVKLLCLPCGLKEGVSRKVTDGKYNIQHATSWLGQSFSIIYSHYDMGKKIFAL